MTGTVVPAVGAAGWRQKGSGQGHQQDLGIASHGLPCTELSQQLQSLMSDKWKLCWFVSTCCALPISFTSTFPVICLYSLCILIFSMEKRR